MKFQDVYIKSVALNRKIEFRDEAEVINTVYTSNIEVFNTKDIWRFIVVLTDNKSIDWKVEDLKGVIKVIRFFDFEEYWSLSIKKRKEVVLRFLHEGVCFLAEKNNIPKKVFDEAFKLTVQGDIKYSGYWADPIISPNGSLEAKVWIEFDFGISVIQAQVKNLETGDLKKFDLIRPKPHYMFFDRCLGKAYWKSDSEFCLESKNGKDKLVAKISNIPN